MSWDKAFDEATVQGKIQAYIANGMTPEKAEEKARAEIKAKNDASLRESLERIERRKNDPNIERVERQRSILIKCLLGGAILIIALKIIL